MEATPVQHMALPLHIQRLENILNLRPYLHEIEQDFGQTTHFVNINDNNELYTNITKTPSALNKQFNFSHVTPERKWVKDLLLSDTDESDCDLSDSEKLKLLLEIQYKQQHKWKKRLKGRSNKANGYQYFSAGLLLPVDKYPEIKKKSAVPPAVTQALPPSRKSGRLQLKRKHADDPRTTTADVLSKASYSDEEPVAMREVHEKERDVYRAKLWTYIVKKEIPKVAKQFSQSRHITQSNNKKIASYCQREVRRWSLKSQKLSKESSSIQPRARRIMKEVLVYWRKYEKVEKEARKRAEKEAQEQQKLYEEMREARRQQRKLNFLITQTELYAHFMSKKITGEDVSTDDILKNLDNKPLQAMVPQAVMNKIEETDDYDSAEVKERVLLNVKNAVEKQKAKHKSFVDSTLVNGVTTDLQQSFDDKFSLANPSLAVEDELSQASIFNGQLKAYQIKGMSWLASLYDQGINGILADEMGLGKTVQSIALLAHLAEHQNTWGPFLIVSPASTLHNWQQECTRFVPVFKVLPYWGSPHERKVIRKYWNQKLLSSRNAPFHVLITSYQLVVQDFKYFQRIKWQYMILDEAQAIKSSSSVRWKMLMSFNCRNRLLLTGTPIQNTMAELWALLHFIMPTMFDSHDEFSEWFSKDIENHAEKKSALDENQLTRLHMILKPFMLRRIKKDVEHEMAEKIEVHLSCGLSIRQRELYRRLRGRISIDDLLHSSITHNNISKESASTLMNLVMQFRKVCNHPDLFESRGVLSPLTNVSVSFLHIPYLIYNEIVHESYSINKTVSVSLSAVSVDNVHNSSLVAGSHLWSFLRHTTVSPYEAVLSLSGSPEERILTLMKLAQATQLLYLRKLWSGNNNSRCLLQVWQDVPLSPPSVSNSSLLRPLLFTSHTSTFYSHLDHYIVPLESRLRNELEVIKSTMTSTNQNEVNVAMETEPMTKRTLIECVSTDIPKLLLTYIPKVIGKPITLYASNRDAENSRLVTACGGPVSFKSVMLYGYRTGDSSISDYLSLSPPDRRGLSASVPPKGWSDIHIPTKGSMITDSGKMVVLDKLLTRLKREGHRVLLYSQMTRMIDILEDYMAYRRHKYIRLDGSSRISDRRDMVEDFQTQSDIFVFILSTRAGGLGINLTAADTVIFYDSDWNPTVDQQAMDRAHRLGQTKQVTVYRLIVNGSIEERILQRANEKSEIQKMVISGGDFKSDTLKPKEVVSLLLDDEEMETRFLAKQAEKRVQEEQTKMKTSKTRKRKLVQKMLVGGPVPPPAKRSTNSASTSPSIAHDSLCNNGSDQINGSDIIDVVGYTHNNNNIRTKSPSSTKLGKRIPKRIKNSQIENKRRKKLPPPVSNNTYPSHSNSFPNSPLSVSSSALNIDTNNGHASTNNNHTSPRASPFSTSVPSQSPSVTPPRRNTSNNKKRKSLHH